MQSTGIPQKYKHQVLVTELQVKEKQTENLETVWKSPLLHCSFISERKGLERVIVSGWSFIYLDYDQATMCHNTVFRFLKLFLLFKMKKRKTQSLYIYLNEMDYWMEHCFSPQLQS